MSFNAWYPTNPMKNTAAAGIPGAADVRGGETNTMRKLLALSMVALLALTLAIAALGCGQKAEEAPAATEMMTDSSAAMTDSSAMMSMDSTATH